MEEVDESELVVERVAALDLGKAGLEACVRVPHESKPGRRMQELPRLRHHHRAAAGDWRTGCGTGGCSGW